jgi:DNA polymerase I-like protein with 3'-5' exonuclease and polymerase domains
MKKYFREGKKPYVEVAKNYFQDDTIDKEHSAYKLFKVICHATNYLGTASGILSRLPKSAKAGNEIDGKAIDEIQKWYFGQFPEIADWHTRVKSQFVAKRYVENVFGYRLWNFGRIEGTIFNEVIASIPQSTVGVLINKGLKNIHDSEPDIQLLLQVHDSLAGQYPIEGAAQYRQKVIDCCSVALPYSEPLVIPVGIKTSAVSWGDCA